MKQHYIYLTTDHLHNKKYIGKHYGQLDDDYYGSGKIIERIIAKYGKKYLSKEVLYISKDGTENSQKEKEFIAAFNAQEDPNFYNIAAGGDGGDLFHTMSIEEQEAFRKAVSARTKGKLNPRYGVKLSDETKEKIRQNRDTSYMQTPEYRAKMSQAVSGEKNGMYGKHHTEESKKKMSEHSIGKTSGQKNGMYGKKGNNALNGKHIFMYDTNHCFIREFAAKTAVLEFLGMKGHIGLDKALKSGEIYKGYYWSTVKI